MYLYSSIVGFLAFRELPPLLNIVNKLIQEHPELKPDVLLVDGNGLLHPQKCGIACHIGYHTSICSIGVAKNLFVMDGVDCTKAMVQNMTTVGDYTLIKDKENSTLGLVINNNYIIIHSILQLLVYIYITFRL